MLYCLLCGLSLAECSRSIGLVGYGFLCCIPGRFICSLLSDLVGLGGNLICLGSRGISRLGCSLRSTVTRRLSGDIVCRLSSVMCLRCIIMSFVGSTMCVVGSVS